MALDDLSYKHGVLLQTKPRRASSAPRQIRLSDRQVIEPRTQKPDPARSGFFSFYSPRPSGNKRPQPSSFWRLQ